MIGWVYDWRWKLLMQFFGGLTWQAYVKPRPQSTRLLNTRNYAEMVVNQEYIRIISVIRCRSKAEGMTGIRIKAKNNIWQ